MAFVNEERDYAYYVPGAEPDFRHAGTDRAEHHCVHHQGDDIDRCPHCFTVLDEAGQCWRCDDTAWPAWYAPSEDELAHPRNAQEALLYVQYVEFRALFEDD